jgi:hypothetical protein
MKVKTYAIKALLASDAMVRAPPVIRDWLIELLVRDEGASRPRESTTRIAPEKERSGSRE